MKLKTILTAAAASLALAGLVACESNGVGATAGGDGARSATYGTNEMTTTPAVDSVSGGSAAVGQTAPNFTLRDLNGKLHTLSDYTEDGKIVVLEWFNPQCPFVVKHYRDADNQTMNQLAKRFKGDDVVWLAVNSGAPGKQGHGMELNKRVHEDWNMSHPILIDESGVVGRAFGAKRTPEMYVIDTNGVLVYHGAIDNNSSPNTLGDTNHVETALEAVLNGRTVPTATTSAYGCSVKYSG